MIAECPQCRRWFEQDQPWKRVCLSCFIANKKQQERQTYTPPPRPREQSLTIPKELVPKLVMLCHPDKHNGSKMSIEVTQKLLELRSK